MLWVGSDMNPISGSVGYNSYFSSANPYLQNNYSVNPIKQVSRDNQENNFIKGDTFELKSKQQNPELIQEKLAKGDTNTILARVSKLSKEELKTLERQVALQREKSLYTKNETSYNFLGKLSELISTVKNERPKEIAKNDSKTTNPFASKNADNPFATAFNFS